MSKAILAMCAAAMVVDFNSRVLGIAQREVAKLPVAESEISIKSLAEELEEFKLYYNTGDFVGTIDSAIDYIYFAIGVMYKCGYTAEQIQEQITNGIGTLGEYAEIEFADRCTSRADYEKGSRRPSELSPENYQDILDSWIEENKCFDHAIEQACSTTDSPILENGSAAIDQALRALVMMNLPAFAIDEIFEAVHNANMEKKLGVNARRGDGSAADAVKPEGWIAPDVRIMSILDTLG